MAAIIGLRQLFYILLGLGTSRDYLDLVCGRGSPADLGADLGGRVGWLPKAERVKTLFLSPLQPQNAGGGGGGGG